MRPEIADLIVGPIYSHLNNHKKVLEYPQVKGVTKNLYFITHSQKENTDTELLSKSNYHEANFISSLCEYLLTQGYKPNQITILTTYLGQMFLLKKVVPPSCAGVRITCVDNYQGEENDIILLSLVRSNEEDKIGFVGIDNRICVSLSRAKHGLYIVGNLESLMKRSSTWKKIGAKLKAGGNFGTKLELICAQHGNKTKVSEQSHFAPLKLGGCGLKCDVVLKCAHRCLLDCYPHDHDKYKCKQKCEKRCPFKHQCQAGCGQECPPCQTPVLKTLPCKHEVSIGCFEDPLRCPCPVILTKELYCKHKKDVACHVKVSAIKCETLVEKKLARCGHTQKFQCYEPMHRVKCDVKVEHTFSCCNSTQRIICFQIGNHNCNKMPNFEHESLQNCKRVCFLGHPCSNKHKLGDICPPCLNLTSKMLKCGHNSELPCHKLPSTHTCSEMIKKLLACGHEQFVQCAIISRDFKCKAECRKNCGVEHACHKKCPPQKRVACHPDQNTTLACRDEEATNEFTEKLECGHEVNLDPNDFICYELILKTYPDCGHERYVLCFLQEFAVCQVEACQRKRLEMSNIERMEIKE
ncbi:NFX1-type zinc finger-containing protein 1 [Orchesella cincta]|uniref:NFX1-type zinc finger-containing protein 1 n=1 Tax=Orchesella cincta TaxID=48709 RepID=A0A1D2MC97_ORCCI|nr:NFX1-type zinc finger-containing protein 1 [Orchesella cincta]